MKCNVMKCNDMKCMKCICTLKLIFDIVLNGNTICKIKVQHTKLSKSIVCIKSWKFAQKTGNRDLWALSRTKATRFLHEGAYPIVLTLKSLRWGWWSLFIKPLNNHVKLVVGLLETVLECLHPIVECSLHALKIGKDGVY